MTEVSIEQLNRPLQSIQAANTALLTEVESIIGMLTAYIAEAGDSADARRGATDGGTQSEELVEAIEAFRQATELFGTHSSGGDSEALAAHQEKIRTLEAENELLKSEVAELREQSEQMLGLLEQQQQCIQQAESMTSAVHELRRTFKAKESAQE